MLEFSTVDDLKSMAFLYNGHSAIDGVGFLKETTQKTWLVLLQKTQFKIFKDKRDYGVVPCELKKEQPDS